MDLKQGSLLKLTARPLTRLWITPPWVLSTSGRKKEGSLALRDLLMEFTWKKEGNVAASFLQHKMRILSDPMGGTAVHWVHDCGTLDREDPPSQSQLAWIVAVHEWNRASFSTRGFAHGTHLEEKRECYCFFPPAWEEHSDPMDKISVHWVHDWGTLDNCKGDPPNLSQLAWLVAQHGWNRAECSSWNPCLHPTDSTNFAFWNFNLTLNLCCYISN